MSGMAVSAAPAPPPRKHADEGSEPMKLLDQYITKTGKQPADWTPQDIQKYLDHVKAQVAKAAPAESHDN